MEVRVEGKEYEMPVDLYIPPHALQVILETTFEGPLDLLLYLIRRHNLDILNIDVSRITNQYIAYIELMESNIFELAGEYLVMAATLAEIKSRSLLPRTENIYDDEEDPRIRLIKQLQEESHIQGGATSPASAAVQAGLHAESKFAILPRSPAPFISSSRPITQF